MAIEHVHNDGVPHSDVGYEPRDLGHRGILVFFAMLFISGVVIHLVIWAMYAGMIRYANATEPARSPLATRDKAPSPGFLQNTLQVNMQKFPEPRLQRDDTTDMNVFLSQEEQYLQANPWTDDKGTVHLPIDVAIKSIAQKGIPARANGTDPSLPNPMVVPTESGFMATAASQQENDATMVPGAPEGDTIKPSDREKEKPIPNVNPNEPRNPARARGEHQAAGPEQPIQQKNQQPKQQQQQPNQQQRPQQQPR